MAGAFPGCSQLWTKAVPCEAEEVFHYHVLDGGARLNHNLDLEEHQREISYQCKSSLAKLIMPSSQEVEEEVVYLPWNCYNCSSNGPTPMLFEIEHHCCPNEFLGSVWIIIFHFRDLN